MVMETPLATFLARGSVLIESSRSAASNLGATPGETSPPDDLDASDSTAAGDLDRELDVEREAMLQWLPRFDAFGTLVGAASDCPWAGLSGAGRTELFRAALGRLPLAHQFLLRLAHGPDADDEALVPTPRYRLAIHHATQALLCIAREMRNLPSTAAIVACSRKGSECAHHAGVGQ
jgi:hypothetical protein